MSKRIVSIDILRGIAVLQMIFWQIFDFFSKADIYSDKPYFLAVFDMPINGIGLALFTFASGASVYLSVHSHLKSNSKLKVFLHSVKRYGGYILLSLLFTTFVFGFNIFYTWKEAVQGVGFAALIASILILFIKQKWLFAIIGLIIAVIQPFLRSLLNSNFIIQHYPMDFVSFNLSPNIYSLFLNSTIRGFFSLTHTLPMLLLGVFMGAILLKKKAAYIFGIVLIAVSLVMHFSYDKIDVYLWSASYLIGFSGFSFVLFWIIDSFLSSGKISRFLSLFGRTAIIAYLLHFILVYKPLKVFGIESAFGSPISYVLAVLCVTAIYQICKIYDSISPT